MASSTTDSPHLLGSILRSKVRIVAKIRPFLDSEIQSSNGFPASPISSKKPASDSSDSSAVILFRDQTTSYRESYKLDYCYEQDEDVAEIFSREVNPLVQGIFQGFNASVLAYGARGSGKTCMIQGSTEEPGLAPLAMAEILSISENLGNSVAISLYEVYQDHVYDLLEPKEKEVIILEDAGGRIQLKGLSQVPVNSISGFYKFYFHECSHIKPAQKVANDVESKSHKGLIIHVSSNDKDSKNHLVSKINFIDLAGYEDIKKMASDRPHLVEIAKIINKSLYALQNVVYALNSNEVWVPYRESKLTRMLQDSIGGKSQALMITCLNPTLCQDTIHTIRLASRSCQAINRTSQHISSKKVTSGGRPQSMCSSTAGRSQSLSISMKKLDSSRFCSIEKKMNGTQSVMKGRTLFPVASTNINPLQEVSLSDVATAVESSTPKVDACLQNENEHFQLPTILCDVKPLTDLEEEENNDSSVNICESSPPISARLREISNALKSLCSPVPVIIKSAQENNSYNSKICREIMEPKTPVPYNTILNENWEVESAGNTGKTFSERNTQLKRTLVQEFLNFLNTARKEELRGLKGIGEKRANYILELREESLEPFKELDDLKEIGLSLKQINGMVRKVAEELFT